MRKTIIKWSLICAVLGVLGVWAVGSWEGLGFIFAPLLKFLGGGKDKAMEKLDQESSLDLQDVKRRKKKIRETNNVTDLASELTASSKRRKRKRS